MSTTLRQSWAAYEAKLIADGRSSREQALARLAFNAGARAARRKLRRGPPDPIEGRELAQLKELYERIVRGVFDELDAKFFMMMLRSQGSPVLTEFGDFVAHPRRSKGRIYKFAAWLRCNLPEMMRRTGDGPTEHQKAYLRKGVFSCDQVYTAVNGALQKLNLAPFTAERVSLLLFVTLVAIEGATFGDGKVSLGTLSLILDQQNVVLAVKVPHPRVGPAGSAHMPFEILKMPNDFHPLPPGEILNVTSTASIRMRDGKMVISL